MARAGRVGGLAVAALVAAGALAACGRGEPPSAPTLPPVAEVRDVDPSVGEPAVADVDAPVAATDLARESTPPDASEPPPEADTPKARNMGWVVLAPEDGGFRMEVPVEPELATSTVAGPNGLATKLRQWNVTNPVSGAMLVVALSPLVQQLVDHGSSERALEGSIRAIAKPNLRLDHIRVIDLAGFAGREAELTLTVEGEGEAHGKVRLYIVGYRMYQLLGMWADEGAHTEVEKALASFELTEDAADLEKHPVDLWQRYDAPFGALDVELPGRPDAAHATRMSVFGQVEVESLSVVSSFPPAAYGLNAWALPDPGEAPRAVLERWVGGLEPKPKKVERVDVLGDVPARRALMADGARLAFVHLGRLYELVWTPLDQGRASTDPTRRATDRERDRWFGSPRVKP